MVIDALMSIACWHPRTDGLNQFNPGGGVSIAQDIGYGREVYAAGGVYLDSYSRPSTTVGVGIRVGIPEVGFDIMAAHVTGSRLNGFPIVPLPSVYVGNGTLSFHVTLVGEAIAVSARVRAWRF